MTSRSVPAVACATSSTLPWGSTGMCWACSSASVCHSASIGMSTLWLHPARKPLGACAGWATTLS
eukprot:4642682-Pyramimonas_sp.AAC.1